MRSDFYYRINMILVELIPLRERLMDIPLLVQDFLHRHPLAIQKAISRISKQTLDCLQAYSWPGNIRELQNLLDSMIVLEKSETIREVRLPKSRSYNGWEAEKDARDTPLYQWIKEQEKQYLIRKLSLFGGRIDLMAKSSCVGVRTPTRKMRSHSLDRRQFERLASKAVSFFL